jgi:hypothetical protein
MLRQPYIELQTPDRKKEAQKAASDDRQMP